MQSITLQTSDSAITSSDILGRINFAASSESDGGAATLQVGSIYALAEGTFSASANPTSIVIATSASDSNPAQNRIKITNEGHIHPMTNNSYDLGSSTLRYRAAYTNALTINGAYSFPTSDGSSNQVLQTNGAGQLSFATVSTGGLSNVVEDTTPQLGGDLDLNGNQILDCVTESSATTNVPLVVQGVTSQSADLAQFKSTSSTLRTKIDTAGRMLFDVDTITTTPSTKGVGPYLKGVAIFDDNDGSMAFYVLRDGTSNYTRSNTNDFRLFTASSNNAVHLKAANTSFGTPTDGLAVYDNDGTTLGEIQCDYANIDINSTTANGITVTAAASQSADIQLWENSSATKLLAVGPDGGLEIPSATPSTTTNKLYNDGSNLNFGTKVIIDSTNVNTGLQYQPIGGGLNVTGLTTTEFAAATLVTAAEGIGSNNNDTTIPTSAAVKAYADSVAGGGGISNVVEDTTPQLGGNLDAQTYKIAFTNGNVAIGDTNTDINTSYFGNIAIGSDAGSTLMGNYNIGIGYSSLKDAAGNNDTFNIGIGQNTLQGVDGNYNIAIGYQAAYLAGGFYGGAQRRAQKNICIGYQAGYEVLGNNNIEISPYNAGSSPLGATNVSDRLNIGHTIFADMANKRVNIGVIGTTSSWTVQSDAALYVRSQATTDISVLVKARTSQSASLQEWQDNVGGKLLAVDSDGVLELPSNVPSTTTNKLYNDGGTLKFNGSAVGGSASAAGSDTQIQFNDGGSFGGDADLVWNKTTNALTITGSLNATTKSFLIDHPSKPGMKLQYASLEGPENGVYVRGTTDSGTITLPDYWRDLVHNGSITVTLTPVGQFQPLFVEQKSNREIRVGGVCGYYDYVVYGERKDVDKLEVEW